MNFFARQDQARRQSRRLVLLFTLAVVAIVVAVDLFFLLAFGGLSGVSAPGSTGAGLVMATLLTLSIIGLGSLYRISSLRQGGAAVATQLGGTPVPEDTRDPHYRRLRNVVEEIAIASGVPVPKIYVLEHEAGINAFAAGYAPGDAAVAVTRGALDKLNRDELQGVIAHEFSHVLNGDMRLNIRLMGVLFGILVLAVVGRKILQHGGRGSRNSKGAGPVLLAALGLMVVGYIGLFFGRLIKAGVSRQREYLADASAVQFTRNPDGIAGALKKIGGNLYGSQLQAGHAKGVAVAFDQRLAAGIGFNGQGAATGRVRGGEPRHAGCAGGDEGVHRSIVRLGHGSCRECCGNSLAACSGHVKGPFFRRRGQVAWVRWAERGFPSRRPFASGSGRRRAAPRAASARSRRRAARSGS